jgi:hypothetical protein
MSMKLGAQGGEEVFCDGVGPDHCSVTDLLWRAIGL